MNQRPSKEILETARKAAIEAIKGYQARALSNEDLEDAFRILLKGCTDADDDLDWFGALFNYHGLMMELVKLVSDPEINTKIRDSYRKDAGKMLVELARFFGDLKHNRTAEAAMHLYYLEEYAPSNEKYLQQLTAEYETKADDCKSGTVLVIG
jgi:hypothetical protein